MTDPEADAAQAAIEALPMLARRRIEAEIVAPLYAELVERLGAAEAKALLTRVIRRSAIAQGQAMRAAQGDGGGGVEGFLALLPRWTAGGALEIEERARDAERLDFDVTRCRYAEMYRAMGLGDIGHILSCNRDGAFCEGYEPRLTLRRSQTIMQGADRCDFRYRMAGDDDA